MIFAPGTRGGGTLRRREHRYAATAGDPVIDDRLARQAGLRPGDEVEVETRPGGRGRGDQVTRIISVHGQPPAALARRPDFARLAAIHPRERLRLEGGRTARGEPELITRVIDLLCPFGKGQRALIVAPAKAGKTTVLQAVARGVALNHPDAALFLFLVDERPEEVSEMEMLGLGEVVASDFDRPPSEHVAAAELLLERCRRLVELGRDVVLVMDSLTRLARAYNAAGEGSRRTLSGGLDANALERPKRFLGSARTVDGGGSLTIIATVLVDTGSRMDQVIFEEFKGTGNSELVLSRELAERRVFPAIDLQASATRREELLLTPAELEASHEFRRRLGGKPALQAMPALLEEFRRHPANAALVAALTGA
ncbi:MAG: transcription termination factor Rho [Gemmatimonadales bacterium]|nr:transcription termination factor Rho [Gemmatimonadales bacterium]